MPASIKDIARRLNISVSTVSYALNGGPRPVREEVRRQVLDLAKEMGYRPSRVARAMVTGQCNTIGIVPPEVGDDVFLGPYLQIALNGISNEAGRNHKDILVFTRYAETDQEEMISTILDGRVDAVIFVAPYFTSKTVELATSLHLPCASISGSAVEGITSFTINNTAGMHLALEHLYSLGHRRIAHIAGRLDMEDSLTRLASYRSFLHEKRLKYQDEFVAKGQFLIEGGRSAMHELMNLPVRPTAIACANDEMAIGAILGAYDLGIKIPEEVSITGFDMTPGGAHIYPQLTTVRQPIGEMGEVAVRAIVDLVERGIPPASREFDTTLVVRGSTGPVSLELEVELGNPSNGGNLS